MSLVISLASRLVEPSTFHNGSWQAELALPFQNESVGYQWTIGIRSILGEEPYDTVYFWRKALSILLETIQQPESASWSQSLASEEMV